MHFWDPEYGCFTFKNINMFPNLEEYGLLTEFPRNLYKVYFYQRRDKVLTKLAELIKVPNLHKILEKSATWIKWKMIEEVFERRKNDSRFVKKKRAKHLL